MRANVVLGGWGVLFLCLAGCARARSVSEAEASSQVLSAELAAAAAGSPAPSPELEWRRRRAADLVLEAPSTGDVLSIGKHDVAEDSCELYEGCALGAGRRAVAEINVNVRNLGRRALDLGAPWESPYFYPSLCQSTQTLYGFIAAEVRDASNRVVAQGSLSTTCIADAVGGYSCVSQGLAPGGSAASQPQGQCDYVDLTGLPSGDYLVRLTVNPSGELPEATRTNNTLEVPLHYIACDGTICGGSCCPEGIACADGVCQLPDLRINAQSAEQSLWLTHQTFEENSCELQEMCVSGSGERRLLQFEGRIENWGPGDLSPGAEEGNPLFEFSPCHGHYHFRNFTDYQLLDASGASVAAGHKQSFCLISMVPVDLEDTPAPPGTRPEPEPGHVELEEEEGGGGCNFLRAGWADIYGVGTPCQWIDVTDVPAGDYTLQLSVNPSGVIAETNTDNNVVKIAVHIEADIPCEPTPEICGDAIDQDCDEQPDTWDEDCNNSCYPGSPFCEPTTEVTGNESCDTAFALSDNGAYRGALSSDDPEGAATCGGWGASGYFRFTLDAEQAVYLGALNSSVDTVIGVFRDDCSAEPLRCSDNACGTANGHFVAILPAGTYVAVVRAKEVGVGGAYELKFQHDFAPGARVLEGPGVYAGDTSLSENRVVACEGYGPESFGQGPEDRYVLATCNTQLTVSTCGASTFRTVLEVRQVSTDPWFEGIQCGLPESGCQADSYGSVLSAYVPSSGLTFLTVDGEGANDYGEYQLSIGY